MTATPRSELGARTGSAVTSPGAAVMLRGCQGDLSWSAFLTEVSVNGVRYVVQREAPVLRRAMWLVLVLAGTVFMAYQLVDCIWKYASYPTSVDIHIQHNTSMLFPAVTICNENTVLRSVIETLGVFELGPVIRPPWPVPGYTPDFTEYSHQLQQLEAAFDGDWSAIYKYLAHPLVNTYNNVTNTTIQGTLLQCSFGGRQCDSNDFVEIRTSMGLCYQFSSASLPKYASMAGSNMALNLVLFVNQREYSAVLSKSAGFHVLVHEPHEPPLMQNYGFLVSPGYTTTVSMEYTSQHDLGPPYGTCYASDQADYRYNACFQSCLVRHIYESCGCRTGYSQGINASICSPRQLYECSIPAQREFVQQGLHESCECPRQCHKMQYHLTMSSGVASHFVIEHLLKTLFTDRTLKQVEEMVRDEYVILEIFFSDLSYLEVSVVAAYSVQSLLCDVGGALGLILGSSLLTFVEFLDFLVCRRCFSHHASCFEGR